MTRLVTWVRTFVLLAVVLDLPVLARVVRAVTRAPIVDELLIEGVAVEIVRPAGRGPWPCWLFVNGAHPERRREPVVERVTRGLARAGFVVFVPELPGLGDGEISLRTLEAASGVLDVAAGHADVRAGRVALAGASVGGGITLLLAARPRHAAHVSVVASISPYAGLQRIVALATTSYYVAAPSDPVRIEVTDLMRHVVARSLVSALPAGDDRIAVLERLRQLQADGRTTLDDLVPAGVALRPGTERVLELLGNGDPDGFAPRFEQLPDEVASTVRGLSPERHAASVSAPVELIAPPDDPYFPLREVEILGELLPRATVTVTGALDHTRPGLARLGAFLAFLGWTTRSLRLAATR